MIDNTSISKQLNKRRKELGLSLSELARRVGTSVPTLSRYESGWTRFEVRTLRKLAVALNCKLDIALRPLKPPPRHRQRSDSAISRLKRLFWDHDFQASDLKKHQTWVVERVLEYGTLEDIHLLRDMMGRKSLLHAVSRTTRLSPRTRSLWRQILEMEGVKCTKTYSRDTAWIS